MLKIIAGAAINEATGYTHTCTCTCMSSSSGLHSSANIFMLIDLCIHGASYRWRVNYITGSLLQ